MPVQNGSDVTMCCITEGEYTSKEVIPANRVRIHLHLLRLPWFASHGLERSSSKNYPQYTYNLASPTDDAWSLFNGDGELAANFLPSDANAYTSTHINKCTHQK